MFFKVCGFENSRVVFFTEMFGFEESLVFNIKFIQSIQLGYFSLKTEIRMAFEQIITQLTFTCSKSTIETQEKGRNNVQC